jgi:hypothetical protein
VSNVVRAHGAESAEFPANPVHGMLFELNKGSIYQYDSATNSWSKIVTNSIPPPVVSDVLDGSMLSEDFKKLNRLVIPPPKSTIIGTDCVGSFSSGTIGLYGDDYIDVQGQVELRNIDSEGNVLSKLFPFHTHQHTYTFDFLLNMQRLIDELEIRNQVNFCGPTGDEGRKGSTGGKGDSISFTGPTGPKGPQGDSLPCILTASRDPLALELKPEAKKVIVGATVEINPLDKTKYDLILQRQAVGSDDPADKLNINDIPSSWILAVPNISGQPQSVSYVDIDPLLEAVRQKFLVEIQQLKQGYEGIANGWLQTMSDLFDEQKAALCCALEFCMSRTKNIDMRQHMESVAGAAVPFAKIALNPRDEDAAAKFPEFKGDPEESKESTGRFMLPGLGEPFGETFDDECIPPSVCTDASFTVTNTQTLTGSISGNLTLGEGVVCSVVFEFVTVPSHGGLTFSANGSFTYTPNPGYIGNDSFDFTGSCADGTARSGTCSVIINVIDQFAPSCINKVFHITAIEVGQGGPGAETTIPAPGVLSGAIDPEGDPLTAILDTCGGVLPCQLTHGTIVAFNSDGSFTYHINDGTADSTTCEVKLKIGMTLSPSDVLAVVLIDESGAYSCLENEQTPTNIICASGEALFNADISSWQSYMVGQGLDSAICLIQPTAYGEWMSNPKFNPSLIGPGREYHWLIPPSRRSSPPTTGGAFPDFVHYGMTGRDASCLTEDIKTHFLATAGSTVPRALGVFVDVSGSMKRDDVTPCVDEFIVWYKQWSLGLTGIEGCVKEIQTGTERWLEEALNALKIVDADCPPPVASAASAASAASVTAKPLKTVTVDPILNSGSSSNGIEVLLGPGKYSATIEECTTKFEDLYENNVKIKHFRNGKNRHTHFLNKGKFKELEHLKNAYNGLSVLFEHEGGLIKLYNQEPAHGEESGNTVISIRHVEKISRTILLPDGHCPMDISHLQWYGKGWYNDRCCGLVVNVAGQDFIVMKRSIGNETSCGGGESVDTQCIAAFMEEFGHPAFAWPTLDGKKFTPIPDVSEIIYKYDEDLNDMAMRKISNGDFTNPKGGNSARYFSSQFSVILFPATQ